MKNKLFILTSLIIIFTFSSCRNEKVNHKKFSVSEEDVIDKIIMSDKKGNKIELKKKDSIWIINNKHKVWDRQIEYTLGVMKDIRVKSSVSEQKMEFVIRNISTSGVKIEIFEQDDKIRSYYIGGNTSDHQGTYMIMEQSNEAYIMHIPDRHPGILNPKYGIEGIYINENIWRKPIVIDFSENNIQEIIVKDLDKPKQSFKIDLENISLYNHEEQKIPFDKSNLSYWNISLKNLQCGAYKPHLKKEDFNLVKKIFIKTNNRTDSLFIYDKTISQSTQKEYNPSVEYKYASWNNSELVIIQNNIFNKVLITLDEFLVLSGEKPQSL